MAAICIDPLCPAHAPAGIRSVDRRVIARQRAADEAPSRAGMLDG